MDEALQRALMRRLAALPSGERERLLRAMPPPAFRAVAEAWGWQAHGGQREPAGDWLTWLIRAGRGFGKTRAGAEWVWERVRDTPGARIALVGGTLDEVARVMVEGPSGLIATAGSGERALWLPSKGVVKLPGGCEAFAYSAARPDALRGPEHHFAWCDELAKWPNADSTWDNLMLGLRLGERPRAVVTTTPRPVPLLRRIRALPDTVETRGRTDENRHTSEVYKAAARARYAGTRFGRQELDGELIEDVAGTLWPRALIEASRVAPIPAERAAAAMRRVAVGVDPPASAAGTCGISVCGLAGDGAAYVLADLSAAGLGPQGWAERAARAAEDWGADRVVAEANNGGDMVASLLKSAAPGMPVRLVHASRGKARRAEPAAAAFERGEAKLAGRFPELEDELAGLTAAGGYEGPGASPDRADAMVWALAELLAAPRAEPRVRGL